MSKKNVNKSTHTAQLGPPVEDEKNFFNKMKNRDKELTVVTISNAESMERIFPQWIQLCYNRGPYEYEPYDINMPATLIPRPAAHYRYDPPLTERGQIVAQTYGRGFIAAQLRPFEIYCAPDMKSVQTAHNIIKGMDSTYTTICIEPALMGFKQLYPANVKNMFLKPSVYSRLGYPVNLDYEPLKSKETTRETIDEYVTRINTFYTQLLPKVEQKSVFIIGDNCLVEITRKGDVDSIDDILTAHRMSTCQMNTIKIAGEQVSISESPVLPFSRSLYATRPGLWSFPPFSMVVPNHPRLN